MYISIIGPKEYIPLKKVTKIPVLSKESDKDRFPNWKILQFQLTGEIDPRFEISRKLLTNYFLPGLLCSPISFQIKLLLITSIVVPNKRPYQVYKYILLVSITDKTT